MMKNKVQINQITNHEWYHRTYGADTFLKLYALAKEKGKIHVLPEVMSVYRLHRNGIWSLIDPKVRKKRMISDFNIMINHFSYPDNYKKKLLAFYIKQYFLFDIRYFNIPNALKTIITLSVIYSAIKMSKTWILKYFS